MAQKKNTSQKNEHPQIQKRIIIQKLSLEYKDPSHDERIILIFTSPIKHRIHFIDIPSYLKTLQVADLTRGNK